MRKVHANEMKSEDDLIITFSPIMHHTNKFGLLKIFRLGWFQCLTFLNDDKSYLVQPHRLRLILMILLR